MKIIAGTGHRPNKLNGFSKAAERKVYDLALSALQGNDVIVISGLALGFDTQLALAALDLGLELWGYIPCLRQDAMWDSANCARYQRIVDRCAKTVYAYQGLYPGAWCMDRRNRMMVDDADMVLALYNGSAGGTGNCVAYAEEVGKPVMNLWKHFT